MNNTSCIFNLIKVLTDLFLRGGLFQLQPCLSCLWIAPSCHSVIPPDLPRRPPTLPASPQDFRAPTLPASAPPSLHRSTAPLLPPPPPPHQALKLMEQWPQASQAPTCYLGQGVCRAALLRTDLNQTRKVPEVWVKTDPASLRCPQRHKRGMWSLISADAPVRMFRLIFEPQFSLKLWPAATSFICLRLLHRTVSGKSWVYSIKTWNYLDMRS